MTLVLSVTLLIVMTAWNNGLSTKSKVITSETLTKFFGNVTIRNAQGSTHVKTYPDSLLNINLPMLSKALLSSTSRAIMSLLTVQVARTMVFLMMSLVHRTFTALNATLSGDCHLRNQQYLDFYQCF
jgi:hypothetical protein